MKNFLITSKDAQRHADVMHAVRAGRVWHNGKRWIAFDEDAGWSEDVTTSVNALEKRGLLLTAPRSMWQTMGAKAALVSLAGSDALKDAGKLLPGKLIKMEHTWDGVAGATWMARRETLAHAQYVIYRDGVEHSRYRTPAAMWQVFHVFAPRTFNAEEMGR